MSDLTPLLESAQAGDRKAAAVLLPLVYDELRKLASAKLAAERPGHTLDATALVNEAWLKLDGESFATKSGFFRAAAVAIRRILVDHARAKKAAKRGGDQARANLDPDELANRAADTDVEGIDAALAEFAVIDPQAAELVQLRYFVGLSNANAALALGISPRTADRIWVYAKSWLYAKLSGDFLA
jgi:RNA polymerase sigma factor (TIGR02999 family)